MPLRHPTHSEVPFDEFASVERSWQRIRDNLRNFLLRPPPEMLSFLQWLREAV